MNRLTVIGRIVRDIELRDVGDGRIVSNNALAIPRTFKTDGGQDTDFIDFVAWGKRAELLDEYCNKGDLVGLDGRIQSRNYRNKNQEKIYVVEMVVETIHFLQPRRNQQNNNQQNNQQNNDQYNNQQGNNQQNNNTQNDNQNNNTQNNNQQNNNQQNSNQQNNRQIQTANGQQEINPVNN